MIEKELLPGNPEARCVFQLCFYHDGHTAHGILTGV